MLDFVVAVALGSSVCIGIRSDEPVSSETEEMIVRSEMRACMQVS